MKKSVLALVTVSMLVLSGCGGSGGGSGGSPEDTKAADNISDFLVEQENGQEVVDVPREDADCIAGGMVDDIGVDQLEKYGFLEKDGTVSGELEEMKMSTDDAESMTNTMFDCTDVMSMMKKGMAAQMGSQDPALTKCIDEVFTEDRTKDILTGIFSGNARGAGEELTAPMMKCAQKATGG